MPPRANDRKLYSSQQREIKKISSVTAAHANAGKNKTQTTEDKSRVLKPEEEEAPSISYTSKSYKVLIY